MWAERSGKASTRSEMRSVRNSRWEKAELTTEAQIFELSGTGPGKGNWTEISPYPIPVHVYHDLSRHSFRIFAVHGTKPQINGVITPSVVLYKASAKFIQWKDTKDTSGLVYGFGFKTETELDRFVMRVSGIITLLGNSPPLAPRPSPPANRQQLPAEPNANNFGPFGAVPEILRLENARLKAALCQSSVNAKMWEKELGELKEANTRLRAAVAFASASSSSGAAENATTTGGAASASVNPLHSEAIRRLRAVLESEGSGDANGDAEAVVVAATQLLRHLSATAANAHSASHRLHDELRQLLSLHAQLHRPLTHPDCPHCQALKEQYYNSE